MQFELPFHPADLILSGLLQAIQFAAGWVWALSFWTKVLLAAVIAARLWWPSLFVETTPPRRRYRRRHRWRGQDG